MFQKWEEYIGWGHVGRLWNKMTFGLTERKVFGEYVFFNLGVEVNLEMIMSIYIQRCFCSARKPTQRTICSRRSQAA